MLSPKTLKIAPLQLNTTVGDVAGNVQKIYDAWKKADAQGADLAVSAELSITGYPLLDLVENPDLVSSAQAGLIALMRASRRMKSGILVGLPVVLQPGEKPYNVTYLIEHGQIKVAAIKKHLPNYDVFDEKRNFASAPGRAEAINFRGVKLGVLICEDTWKEDVARDLAIDGAQVLISVNASPFEANKVATRMVDVAGERANDTGLPILYVNQVGGQDEVVFDGGSMALNDANDLAFLAPLFEEDVSLLTLDVSAAGRATFRPANAVELPDELEQIWQALVVGTRDYIRKIGKSQVVLGMSGGIDSALVAAIAADALGPQNVHLVSMPYKYTSTGTRNDARTAAQMLGANFEELPISDAVEGLQKALGPHFNAQSKGAANENDQARVRGTILMHISNEKGVIVLSTGNKSEVGVGYCTLYGDMNGGFNPLKDVEKTLVFKLAKWRNENVPPGALGPKGPVMPQSIIDRKPSAELAPGQVDEDSLPPYPVLDEILERYVENDEPVASIARNMYAKAQPLVAAGRYKSAEDMVENVVSKVDRAEFKRQQACPGVKITQRAFGRGRRWPVAKPIVPKMITDLHRLFLR